jgi:hypothetical protein
MRKRPGLPRAYKDVFETPSGKRVLHDILTVARVFGPIEAATEIEAHRAEGARSLATYILSHVSFPDKAFDAVGLHRDVIKENDIG